MRQFTIITACTQNYLKKLRWTLPTWVIKPQFRNSKLIIFYNGLKEKDLEWAKEYFSDCKLINWNMPKYSSTRELMLSAFILGYKHIETEFSVKLDADVYFLNDKNVFDENDFNYDVVGHRWGYTKPGYWINILDNFFYNTKKPIDEGLIKFKHSRIASFCCLQRTSLLQAITDKVGGRLPIPSHDTCLWYFADKWNKKILRKSMKRRGVGCNSQWKNIRENVCAHECAFNDFLNKELLKHVQIEITSFCQLGCNNCDRNCGLIKGPAEFMTLSQIYKFVQESLDYEYEWKRIDIIGGEPCYYPYLDQLWDIVKIYKNKYPKCKIRFSTNGLGKHVAKQLNKIPHWVKIRNSNKDTVKQQFSAYNCAPIDYGINDIRSCSVPWRCGIGLTKYGYFLCGAGGSLAKVFGFNIGIKSLKELTIDKLKAQRLILCKYCGHSHQETKHYTTKQEISESWRKALDTLDLTKMELY